MNNIFLRRAAPGAVAVVVAVVVEVEVAVAD